MSKPESCHAAPYSRKCCCKPFGNQNPFIPIRFRIRELKCRVEILSGCRLDHCIQQRVRCIMVSQRVPASASYCRQEGSVQYGSPVRSSRPEVMVNWLRTVINCSFERCAGPAGTQVIGRRAGDVEITFLLCNTRQERGKGFSGGCPVPRLSRVKVP